MSTNVNAALALLPDPLVAQPDTLISPGIWILVQVICCIESGISV